MIDTESQEITVTTDPSRLDLDVIHGYLTRSYWARGISRALVARSMAHSLCFGAFAGDRQVGFARVVSDRATFAYVCDVFVLESHQGRGVGKQLMAAIMGHPELQGLRRLALFTRDAHGLYRQYGFRESRFLDRFMEVVNDRPYDADAGPAPRGAAV
jgi:ribosomal protein S18 acetylase RimI-like enzyme